MNIWNYLENSNFAGLTIFSLEDIIEAIKHYDAYVLSEDYRSFQSEKEAIRIKADNDIKTLLPEVIEKYDEAIKNDEIPDEDPEIVEARINGRLRNDLINLIKKYFNPNVFAIGKWSLPNYQSNDKKAKADSNDLAIALVPIRNQLYTFLSVIGHFQYWKHYFLSKEDWKTMNYIYSKDAAKVNEPLGYKYKPLSLFLKEKRINPGKARTIEDDNDNDQVESSVAEKIVEEINKEEEPEKQTRYIDVDKISLEEFILRYFKTNIEQLIEIAHIIRKTFDLGKKDNFEIIKNECNDYISLCEAQHLMVKL